MGVKKRIMATPMMPAHWSSFHKRYAAPIVVNGEIQTGCKQNSVSNRFKSFDNKFTNFPGAASLWSFCDNRRTWNKIHLKRFNVKFFKCKSKNHQFNKLFGKQDWKGPHESSLHNKLHNKNNEGIQCHSSLRILKRRFHISKWRCAIWRFFLWKYFFLVKIEWFEKKSNYFFGHQHFLFIIKNQTVSYWK